MARSGAGTAAPRSILIVEDDADTAEMMSELLETAGFTPVFAANAKAAIHAIAANEPDLVLLDLTLPDANGIDFLRRMREQSSLPLIVYGDHKSERVAALNEGADDYVAQPFVPEILVARIRALLRRVHQTPTVEPKLSVRGIEIDLARRQASMRGQRLHLTPIEYGILVVLLRHAGHTISHEELLRAVWGDQYEGDYSVLRVNISRLRQKLEENPRHPTYIVTVPGQGYIVPIRRS
jgi:two-component system KDP operon response regulator KdpE